MSKEGKLLIYCFEQYKSAKNMTGRQIAKLFRDYQVSDYIVCCFEALHTTGSDYIVEDIDLFIKERK